MSLRFTFSFITISPRRVSFLKINMIYRPGIGLAYSTIAVFDTKDKKAFTLLSGVYNHLARVNTSLGLPMPGLSSLKPTITDRRRKRGRSTKLAAQVQPTERVLCSVNECTALFTSNEFFESTCKLGIIQDLGRQCPPRWGCGIPGCKKTYFSARCRKMHAKKKHPVNLPACGSLGECYEPNVSLITTVDEDHINADDEAELGLDLNQWEAEGATAANGSDWV